MTNGIKIIITLVKFLRQEKAHIVNKKILCEYNAQSSSIDNLFYKDLYPTSKSRCIISLLSVCMLDSNKSVF